MSAKFTCYTIEGIGGKQVITEDVQEERKKRERGRGVSVQGKCGNIQEKN